MSKLVRVSHRLAPEGPNALAVDLTEPLDYTPLPADGRGSVDGVLARLFLIFLTIIRLGRSLGPSLSTSSLELAPTSLQAAGSQLALGAKLSLRHHQTTPYVST